MSERNELTSSQLSFQKRLIKGFIADKDGDVKKKEQTPVENKVGKYLFKLTDDKEEKFIRDT